jgi:glycosyltransferase involved in cell wall biosynthesis
MLKYNLKKADRILSTSHVMAQETKLYTNKNIEVTPFGINIEQFCHMEVDSLFDKDDIVVGTIKSLEEVYGIEYLIRAFKVVSDKYKFLPLKLLIVGGGSLESSLKKLVKELNIEDKTIFTGKIPFIDVPKYHNMLSISVFVSNSESFGVAIIEASACGKPVVVSNIGGLPEVVEDGVSGFVVPAKNPQKTAEAIEKLVLDKNLREEIGRNGRERVKRLYNWDDNVNQMIKIYKELIK